jgi:predicted dehydrogenase
MEKVKWGIIGCGDVTEVKSGPALQQAEGSELVAVMRRNAKLAEDYARRHHVPKWYANADELIHDPEVNAVYIATPPSSHKEYTLKAAQAGKPVYVEKPMAMNYAECNEMIAACKSYRVPLFVAYYRRALPRFLFVKKQLDNNRLGEILTVKSVLRQRPSEKDTDPGNWRVKKEIAGCGYFCDLASHMLDLLQFCLGPVKNVSGISANLAADYQLEDTVTAVLQFASGPLATGEWSFSSSEHIDRTEINGTKGKIIYSVFEDSPVILQVNDKVSEHRIEHPPHIQQPLIQTVVDELLGKGKSPSNGVTAAQTNRLMEIIISGK